MCIRDRDKSRNKPIDYLEVNEKRTDWTLDLAKMYRDKPHLWLLVSYAGPRKYLQPVRADDRKSGYQESLIDKWAKNTDDLHCRMVSQISSDHVLYTAQCTVAGRFSEVLQKKLEQSDYYGEQTLRMFFDYVGRLYRGCNKDDPKTQAKDFEKRHERHIKAQTKAGFVLDYKERKNFIGEVRL